MSVPPIDLTGMGPFMGGMMPQMMLMPQMMGMQMGQGSLPMHPGVPMGVPMSKPPPSAPPRAEQHHLPSVVSEPLPPSGVDYCVSGPLVRGGGRNLLVSSAGILTLFEVEPDIQKAKKNGTAYKFICKTRFFSKIAALEFVPRPPDSEGNARPGGVLLATEKGQKKILVRQAESAGNPGDLVGARKLKLGLEAKFRGKISDSHQRKISPEALEQLLSGVEGVDPEVAATCFTSGSDRMDSFTSGKMLSSESSSRRLEVHPSGRLVAYLPDRETLVFVRIHWVDLAREEAGGNAEGEGDEVGKEGEGRLTSLYQVSCADWFQCVGVNGFAFMTSPDDRVKTDSMDEEGCSSHHPVLAVLVHSTSHLWGARQKESPENLSTAIAAQVHQANLSVAELHVLALPTFIANDALVEAAELESTEHKSTREVPLVSLLWSVFGLPWSASSVVAPPCRPMGAVVVCPTVLIVCGEMGAVWKIPLGESVSALPTRDERRVEDILFKIREEADRAALAQTEEGASMSSLLTLDGACVSFLPLSSSLFLSARDGSFHAVHMEKDEAGVLVGAKWQELTHPKCRLLGFPTRSFTASDEFFFCAGGLNGPSLLVPFQVEWEEAKRPKVEEEKASLVMLSAARPAKKQRLAKNRGEAIKKLLEITKKGGEGGKTKKVASLQISELGALGFLPGLGCIRSLASLGRQPDILGSPHALLLACGVGEMGRVRMMHIEPHTAGVRLPLSEVVEELELPIKKEGLRIAGAVLGEGPEKKSMLSLSWSEAQAGMEMSDENLPSISTSASLLLDVSESISEVPELPFFAKIHEGGRRGRILGLTSTFCATSEGVHSKEGGFLKFETVASSVALSGEVGCALFAYGEAVFFKNDASSRSIKGVRVPNMANLEKVAISEAARLLAGVTADGDVLLTRLPSCLKDGGWGEVWRAGKAACGLATLREGEPSVDDLYASPSNPSVKLNPSQRPPEEVVEQHIRMSKEDKVLGIHILARKHDEDAPDLLLLVANRPPFIYKKFYGDSLKEWRFALQPQATCDALEVEKDREGDINVDILEMVPKTGHEGWWVGVEGQDCIYSLFRMKSGALVCHRSDLGERRKLLGLASVPSSYNPSGVMVLASREERVFLTAASLAEVEVMQGVSLPVRVDEISPAISIPLGATPRIVACSERGWGAVSLSRPVEVDLAAEAALNNLLEEDDDDEIITLQPTLTKKQQDQGVAVGEREEHSISIFKGSAVRTSVASFTAAINERITAMDWLLIPEIDPVVPVLAVGLSLQPGGEKACRGRVLLLKVDLNSDSEEDQVGLGSSLVKGAAGRCEGCKIISRCETRQAVTIVQAAPGETLLVAAGCRLQSQKWCSDAKSLRVLALHDVAMMITSVERMRNLVVVGDVLRGVNMARFRELNNIFNMSMEVRSRQTGEVGAFALGHVRLGSSVAVVLVDLYGAAHLLWFPTGAEKDLVPCVPMQLISDPASSLGYFPDAQKIEKCFLMTSIHGGISAFLPLRLTDKLSLASNVAAQLDRALPFPGGCTPRGQREVGMESKVMIKGGAAASMKALDGLIDLQALREFLHLSAPLQVDVAENAQQESKNIRNLLRLLSNP